MKQLWLALIAGIVFAQSCPAVDIELTGPWKADWEQLRTRPYPQWFKDAKLGVFIHWGVYSVPSYGGKESYGEWYLRGLQAGDELRTGFMKRVYGENFTYRDFASLFKAELFDANEWADIFKRAGARYIIFVSKHHDGYCLWPSKQAPNWNSVEIGPRRDIIGELTKAVRKNDMRMGLYYSLPEWNHPLHRWYTDPHRDIGKYVETHMIPQFMDLVSAYRPSLIFADGEWFNSAEEWRAAELIAWYYNLVGDDAIVNDRWGGGSNIGYKTPEYSSGIKDTRVHWAEVRGMGRSFGLNRNEKLEAYMSPSGLIHFFVNAVAHGGGITLNVGPKADGQIPLLQQERLIQLGDWLKVNGEAIYGSTPWQKQVEEREVTLERIDPVVDFTWVRNSPGEPVREDDFTAEWNGFIQARYSEPYTFEVQADDGARVWIDGKQIINKWKKESDSAEGNVMGNITGRQTSGTIELKAGRKYPIKIAYYENKKNAMMRLSWFSESQKKQIIPQSQFFSQRDKKSGDGLKGVYQSLAPYICYTQNNGAVYAIVLNWPGAELLLPIRNVGRIRRVSLLGYATPLKHQIQPDGLRIDLSHIYHNHLPCLYAWTFKIETSSSTVNADEHHGSQS